MFIPTNLHTTSIFFFFNDTATTEIYTLSLTRRSSDLLAPMEIVEIEHLQRQFETNLFGVVRVTQRVLPEMRERRRGRIINMSSAAGKVAQPLYGPYSASKFALEAISDALRVEVSAFGIFVVLIEGVTSLRAFRAFPCSCPHPMPRRRRTAPTKRFPEMSRSRGID